MILPGVASRFFRLASVLVSTGLNRLRRMRFPHLRRLLRHGTRGLFITRSPRMRRVSRFLPAPLRTRLLTTLAHRTAQTACVLLADSYVLLWPRTRDMLLMKSFVGPRHYRGKQKPLIEWPGHVDGLLISSVSPLPRLSCASNPRRFWTCSLDTHICEQREVRRPLRRVISLADFVRSRSDTAQAPGRGRAVNSNCRTS